MAAGLGSAVGVAQQLIGDDLLTEARPSLNLLPPYECKTVLARDQGDPSMHFFSSGLW